MDVMESATTAVSALSLPSKPSKGKIAWPEAPLMKQFSLPDNIIYYMAKNPSTPDVYLKLAQSCKYFFEKNPILLAARVEEDGRKICSKSEFECMCIINKKHECCINIDITKLSSKIWITDRFEVYGNSLSLALTLIQTKLYRCETAEFYIGWCSIEMEEFKLLASKFQKFCLFFAQITDNDGDTVMLETILESIPNIKEFRYTFDYLHTSATVSTIKNILKLGNLKNIQHISLFEIPPIITVKDLDDFIKDHKGTRILFDFCHTYLSQEYKKQLGSLVDTVIASGISNCVILYNGQNEKKREFMKNRYTF